MRPAHLAVPLAALLLAASVAATQADPASDAPEERFATAPALPHPASYPEALARWRTPEHVNAWIGTQFHYDMPRALALSETQRARDGGLPILEPAVFFGRPAGMCVDLARFAVETLRTIAPAAAPRYLMIEFDPATIRGQTLRRHWLAVFERDGQLWFFADSKRPGHLAGPYPTAEDFLRDYARYRGRAIVSHRVTDSYARRMRAQAARTP